MNTSTANAFAIHTKQSEIDEQLSREAAAPGRDEFCLGFFWLLFACFEKSSTEEMSVVLC